MQMHEWLVTHSAYAPWIAFALLLLAGLNIPISIDIIVCTAAVLAATTLQHQVIPLFIALLIGSILSASLCYGLGRFLGKRVLTFPVLRTALSAERLLKIQQFYHRYGGRVLIVGRFIPFGVRNALFMSAGVSHMPYRKFFLFDTIACTLWCSLSFTLYYLFAEEAQGLLMHIKHHMMWTLIALSVTGILLFWYKRKRALSKKR